MNKSWRCFYAIALALILAAGTVHFTPLAEVRSNNFYIGEASNEDALAAGNSDQFSDRLQSSDDVRLSDNVPFVSSMQASSMHSQRPRMTLTNNRQPMLVFLLESEDVRFSDAYLTAEFPTVTSYWSNVFFGTESPTVNTFYREASHGFDLQFIQPTFLIPDGTQLDNLPNRMHSVLIQDGVVLVRMDTFDHDRFVGWDAAGLMFDVVWPFIDSSSITRSTPWSWTLSEGIFAQDFQIYVVRAGGGNEGYSVMGQSHTMVDGHLRYVSIVYHDGIPQLGGYAMNTEMAAPEHGLRIDTSLIIHEVGHMLGLPDLDSCMLIFAYDPMAGPLAHFSAWSNKVLGFVEPTIMSVQPGMESIIVDVHSAQSNEPYNIIKVTSAVDPGQYFLIENRQSAGYDLIWYDPDLPHSGIVIWHIVDDVISQGFRFWRPNINPFHRGVGIVAPAFRADGRNIFGPDSVPNTNFYEPICEQGCYTQGGLNPCHLRNMPTHIEIEVLSNNGHTMQVRIGSTQEAPLTHLVTRGAASTVSTGNMTITPEGTQTVGTIMTVMINPPAGQQIVDGSISISGVPSITLTTSGATFPMPEGGGEIIVNAVFEPISPANSISVSTQGDGIANANVQLAQQGTEVTLTAIANSGYQFATWIVISDNVTLSSLTANPATFIMPDDEVVILAVFDNENILQHIVTFNLNGGAILPNDAGPIIVYIDDGAQILHGNVPHSVFHLTSSSSEHIGWLPQGASSDLSPMSAAQVGQTVINEPITFYAQWAVEVHSITFDLNGGNIDGNQNPVFRSVGGGQHIISAGEIPIPERTNHTFDGWLQQSGAPVTMTALQVGMIVPQGNQTYIAQWVAYNPSESPGPSQSPIPTVSPVPYQSPSPNVSPVPYQSPSPNVSPSPGQSPSPTASPSPQSPVPTASPSPNQSPVPAVSPNPTPVPGNRVRATFSPNQGWLPAGENGIREGYVGFVIHANNFPTPTPLTGYRFIGWFYQGQHVTWSVIVDRNITLIAHYERVVVERNYTLTFTSNGGVMSTSTANPQTHAYGTMITAFPTPTRTGFVFAGWMQGNNMVSTPFRISGNTTLTAAWDTVIPPTPTPLPSVPTGHLVVAFDPNLGSFAGIENGIRTGTYGFVLSNMPSPTRVGYTFAGWHTGGASISFPLTVQRDMTISALWTHNVPERPNPQTSPMAVTFTIFGAIMMVSIAIVGIMKIAGKQLAAQSQYKADITRHTREERILDILNGRNPKK